MNTVFHILARDARRIAARPVAVIVTVGVCLIPSLYAWINILANWDPYANTSTVPIAVVIEDEGAELPGMGAMNAGEMIRERLEENDQLGWTFVDDERAAVDGVSAGTYYAAFVVPRDFTATLAGVLDGATEPAHIAYYVNEKANAIAPKVTDTGATTLEAQISSEFARVAGETVSERIAEGARGAAERGDDAVAGTVRALEDTAGLLRDVAGDLDGTQGAVSAARDAAASAATTLDGLAGSSRTVAGTLDDALASMGDARSEVQGGAAALAQALKGGAGALAELSSEASYDVGRIAGDVGWAQGRLDTALAQMSSATESLSQLKGALEDSRDAIAGAGVPAGGAQTAQGDIVAELDRAIAALQTLIDDQTAALDRLEGASDDIKAGAESASGLAGAVNDAIAAGTASLDDLSSDLETSVLPDLSAALDDLADLGGRASGTATGLAGLAEQAAGTIDGLDAVLDQAGAAAADGAGNLREDAGHLEGLARDLSVVSGSQALARLRELGELDPAAFGSYLAQPVELTTEAVFPVANYGSGVAPFYTNLALWVGGFVLVAIYKLEVDREGLRPGELTPRRAFFARWLLIVALGQVQAIICCTGDILLGIQCTAPWAYVLAGMVASFVYVTFVFSLAVAFKHIGKALGVLLVVLQIPGASGTYPIEMMPPFFRAIGPWLPFTYGIGAMREAVGGFFGTYYPHDLGMLLLFLVPAFAIGLIARKRLVNVNALFDRRLAESGLMFCDRDDLEGARPGIAALAQALALEPRLRKEAALRARRFERAYPHLVRRGVAALVAVPLVLLALMFVLHRTFALLICWIASLAAASAYLIVIEYLRDQAARTLRLAGLSPDELHGLIDRTRKEGSR